MHRGKASGARYISRSKQRKVYQIICQLSALFVPGGPPDSILYPPCGTFALYIMYVAGGLQD